MKRYRDRRLAAYRHYSEYCNSRLVALLVVVARQIISVKPDALIRSDQAFLPGERHPPAVATETTFQSLGRTPEMGAACLFARGHGLMATL